MIITCENCNKKFDVDPSLIPEKGRLLQCNSCNHTWFFKNQIEKKISTSSDNVDLKVFESDNVQPNSPIKNDNAINKDKPSEEDEIIEKKPIKEYDTNKEEINKSEIKSIKKKSNVLNLTIVILISFVALIILIDTFKSPIGKIVPNIEFLLYNLYESIKDISLFLIDLI